MILIFKQVTYTMSDHILFIDVETTGLPITRGYDKYYSPEETQYYDKSRVIELAYAICTYDGKLIEKYNELIIPDGFNIENTHIHGIKEEDAYKYGKYIKEVLDRLCVDLDKVSTIVAHNINFDMNIILAECYRYGNNDLVRKINSKNKQCTMAIGRNLMKTYKSPKLVELYHYLFKRSVSQDHRAFSDVMLCLECYFEIVAYN